MLFCLRPSVLWIIVDLFGDGGLMHQSIVDKNMGWITAAGICFFLGAMAKSAQFPLHLWLPDAMEGPTSVSSLIHAATMVAAGVFLLSTIFPLFNDVVLLIIALVGTITATFAAIFALAQYDIKKILAFSYHLTARLHDGRCWHWRVGCSYVSFDHTCFLQMSALPQCWCCHP
ncbi:proton-conducting transporter membrane subunit [Sphingobacterium sp. T2]|uniref:proton-conducting transporter transmembrane domain-containing protein n=1 Tax=Sphingobacterium sp. T2 TaxID=1590596 RepID=UPI0021D2E85B|nr:proton-conducting transporter membrane subunit [Sphingobacterium sp. T2]